MNVVVGAKIYVAVVVVVAMNYPIAVEVVDLLSPMS